MKTLKLIALIFALMLAYLLSAKAVAADMVPTNSQIVLIFEDQEAVEEQVVQDDLEIGQKVAKKVSLLKWKTTEEVRQTHGVSYDRQKQFGKWIQFKKTKGCFDTRAQVLIRDSLIQATSIDNKPCTIEKGEWFDPYTGQKFENDDQIQIDHMVPLKEAYEAGANTWTPERRCVYANFTAMKEHLISTSNFENQSKSDKTPEFYMPPRHQYHCTYLKSWLSVKLIWNLSMTSSEARAIRGHMQQAGCRESEFSVLKDQLAELRQKATALEAVCPIPRRP